MDPLLGNDARFLEHLIAGIGVLIGVLYGGPLIFSGIRTALLKELVIW